MSTPALATQLDNATGQETFQKSMGGVIMTFGVPYPSGVTPLNSSSGNKSNQAATASLPATAGKTNFVTGFEITSGGAVTALLAVATLTGLVGGQLDYVIGVLAGAVLLNQPLVVVFNPPLPASGVNVAINLTVPALGIGNTNAAATIRGFQM